MGTHKGSWDRSNPQKVQESEYWKPENVEKRKIIAKAFSEGWRDIHGGDTGAYWRGINPTTGRCEKLPDQYLSQAKFDQLKQDVIKLHTPD